VQALLITLLIGSLLLAPTLATTAAARKPTIAEKYAAEQRRSSKEAARESDAADRDNAIRVKLKKARQTRRSMVRNGEDTIDIDDDIERLKRTTGDDE